MGEKKKIIFLCAACVRGGEGGGRYGKEGMGRKVWEGRYGKKGVDKEGMGRKVWEGRYGKEGGG